MAQVRKLSPEQLQEEFDKIQRAVAFTRGLKRDGSPMTTAFSKKLKTGDVEVDVEAPSHGVPQEVEVEAPSQDVSREKVDAPSHSQNYSELKKGVHTSQSTILIKEGDPDAEHKLCIKYASDEDFASDCDTPVHLYAVVDWELLPTGLGSINAIYRLDNSRKYFTSLREILHLVTRADLMTIYGRVMTFYQDKKAEGVGLVLWGDLKILMDSPEVNDGSDFWKNQHTWSIQNWKLYSFSGVHVLETVSGLVIHMFVDKKYPLTINLIERMLDHQLEICHGTVGNELTTAVQLIAFLKKQISDSKRPKVHEWVINSPCYHNKELASPEQTATAEVVPKSVAGSSFPAASSTYVVPTGRVVVPTGRYVVPAGKAHCKNQQRERMVYGNNYNKVNYNYTTKRTHPNSQRNMVPRAVLMKTGLKPFNTAKIINTVHPKSIVFSAKPMPHFSKIAQSTIRRPFQPKIVLTNKRFTQKVNTAKAQAVNTARPKAVKTGRPNFVVVNAVRVNQANVAKASACWGKPQQDDIGFVDSGWSRHMTGNIAYLSYFKEFDGGWDTKIPQSSGPPVKVGDEAVHKELGNRMERDATTASSLEADHIRYALSASPTIYTSLIEQFWKTSTLCTIDDGVLGITATIDRKKSLSNWLLWVQHQGEEPSIQTTPKIPPSKITSSPSLSSHHTLISTPITPTKEAAPMPHESPLHSVHSLRRDEGSMKQHELMDLVTKLTDRIGVLKQDLQQTKKTYSTALTRLILRVKSWRKMSRHAKLGEGLGLLFQRMKMLQRILPNRGGRSLILIQIPQSHCTANIAVSTADAAVTTASASISIVSPPRVSTAEDISGAETLVYIRRSASKAKDKGKAIM
ncbi:hypothetical protein Tco_0874150 [Tanacetum coccineum]|uniref:Uncharacterized protein n=1 Tax=Tanacetum coccineum TaxID=301880 RepID=A0ABQ5BRH6_9ASTR